jgi:hypothetical protein
MLDLEREGKSAVHKNVEYSELAQKSTNLDRNPID